MSDVVSVVVHGVVSAMVSAVQGGHVVGCVVDDAICDDATFLSVVEVGGVAGWGDTVGVRVVVIVVVVMSDDAGDAVRLGCHVDGAGWSWSQRHQRAWGE